MPPSGQQATPSNGTAWPGPSTPPCESFPAWTADPMEDHDPLHAGRAGSNPPNATISCPRRADLPIEPDTLPPSESSPRSREQGRRELPPHEFPPRQTTEEEPGPRQLPCRGPNVPDPSARACGILVQ